MTSKAHSLQIREESPLSAEVHFLPNEEVNVLGTIYVFIDAVCLS